MRIYAALPVDYLEFLEQQNRTRMAELGQAPYDWAVCGL